MGISNVVGQQYAFLLPVGLVIVFAVLVFAFGFKSSVEPPNFKHLSLSSDERKSLKKKKPKEKKVQINGHATVVVDDSEGKTKPLRQSNKADTNKVKKIEDVKKSPAKADKKVEKRSGKENQETTKQKKQEKIVEDKPTDFDDGEWETAFSRKDKKNRKKEDDVNASAPEKTPKKKSGEKKSPKQDRTTAEDKTQSSKKSSQQNRTPTSSPGGKQADEAKENEPEPEGSPEKKIKSTISAVEEDVPVVEPKPQNSLPKEKKPAGANPEATTEKPSKPKESEQSNDSQAESGPVFNELEDQWKEAPQKKILVLKSTMWNRWYKIRDAQPPPMLMYKA